MSDEARNSDVQDATPTPEAPTPPRFEVRQIAPGFNVGDEYHDGVLVGRVPLDRYPDSVVTMAGEPGATPSNPDEVAELRRERDELKAQYEEIEPFGRMAQDRVFLEIVEEKISRGEMEPPWSPPPAPEDIVGYHKRIGEPESASILQAMQQYANTLPEWQRQELDSNERVWNAAFDRFKKAGAGSLPRPRPAAYGNPPLDRRTMETILRSKEVREARVEPPGPAIPDPEDEGASVARNFARVKAQHQRTYAVGNAADRERADTALVEAWFREPKAKRPNSNF